MQKIFLILSLITFMAYPIKATPPPTKTYTIKYIMDSRGNISHSLASVTVTDSRITVKRNDYTKYWDCQYLGTFEMQPDKVKYRVYYLTNLKVNFSVSESKIIEYNGTYYYHINFDGEGQLAL